MVYFSGGPKLEGEVNIACGQAHVWEHMREEGARVAKPREMLLTSLADSFSPLRYWNFFALLNVKFFSSKKVVASPRKAPRPSSFYLCYRDFPFGER